MASYSGGLWGSCLANFEQLWDDLDRAMRRWLSVQDGRFLSDNPMAWERNFGFLDDSRFAVGLMRASAAVWSAPTIVTLASHNSGTSIA